MTRMEELESCLSGLLSTLKKNREHVPLEVLKTQYKQPYEELVRNINLTASAYAKSVLLHRLVLNPDADDYITKPFEIQEVLARIQVQFRHMQQEPEHKSVSYKNLELDRERFEVRIAGVLLPKITKQEFAILELLLEHPKQVFSKEEIFEYAWDEHYMGETKTLDVHISNIRKKIKAVTQEEYIDTVWGIGYRLHS